MLSLISVVSALVAGGFAILTNLLVELGIGLGGPEASVKGFVRLQFSKQDVIGLANR